MIYLIISGMFAFTTCVLCTVSIVRCYMRDSHINWNVDDINPHWDEDQVRVYHIRRLQRQIQLYQNDSGNSSMERELEELEQDNIEKFLCELEDIRYDSTNNEFDTKECVICMEEFTNGAKLKRIPICRHFMHADCVKGWFTSKA